MFSHTKLSIVFIRYSFKHDSQIADPKIGKFRGGREANFVEPLNAIIGWLMENPDIAWRTELREAAQARVPELYVL